ncbi:DUF3800 domain-containing protein [Aquibacillus sediminis]|uniref:DUF3800 domain-containing protein n=1 Tax=Aquibacillus sediminis TaxID=2574734 RepID=UPI001108E436|nr:DUF3800 domain-containing protein [Aquibacillus sediminis]
MLLQKENIKVFFDESGKRKNKPNLMGAISVPSSIYSLPEIELLSQKLRDGQMKLHWHDVTGKSEYRDNIMRSLKAIIKYQHLIKFNVIHYNFTALANRRDFGEDLIEKMIYTKFPERIIYGLLRGYGRSIDVITDIYIEESTEYASFELNKLIKEQLNIQSLYRGENYYVSSSQLVPKGEEIGVEVTDLLLGVMRNILENKPNETSKGYAIRNEVIIELLQDENFYNFISSIKYFEWTNTKELTEIDFNDYLQLFISKHLKRNPSK